MELAFLGTIVVSDLIDQKFVLLAYAAMIALLPHPSKAKENQRAVPFLGEKRQ
jgi:hypothetical protein